MPTTTYTPLANVTLGSNAATITFSSISQSYRDLVLVINNAKEATSNGASMLMRLNSDSGVNYTNIYINGNGTSGSSNTGSDNAFYLSLSAGMSTTNPSDFIVNIMDYSTTDKHKMILVRNSVPSSNVAASVERWASTSTVSTITLLPFTGSIASGTSAALYGILA
jgi:hypothetical protein